MIIEMMILFMSVYEMYYFACSTAYVLIMFPLMPFPVYLVYIDLL